MKKSRPIFAASPQSRLKTPRNLGAVAVGIGVCSLLLGGAVLISQNSGIILGAINGLFPKKSDPSLVLSLAEQSASERAAKLKEIASGSNSPSRSQARYLLAADLIEQKQGEQALKWLEGLDWDYSLLAPYIALKRAQAYEAMGDKTKAEKAWQELLQRYPDQPTVAEALTALERTKPKDWEKAIAKFPSHPRSLAMVRQWLKQDPQQPQLIFILAKYASEQPQIVEDLDRLTAQPQLKLKPEEWEAVALAYWENKQYGKASKAYIRSPKTPANAYRIARGCSWGTKWLKPELPIEPC
jgi:soluble lytic murein transglycosylase